MEGARLKVTASQELVVGEHDSVVGGIALMTALLRPTHVAHLLEREAADIVAVHVKVRAAVDNPQGQLLPATTAQHHTRGVEATPVEQTLQSGILS